LKADTLKRSRSAAASAGVARQGLLFILIASLVRLGFAWALGLGVDESYMVATGRHLAFGYFDHPPSAWWMQWAAVHLFSSEAPLAVRAPFIALFALTTWLMLRLGTAVADERAGRFAAIALNLSPVFGVTAGSWVLPDGPLDCALTGAALCFVHAISDRGWRWWIGTGSWAGLALLSKYTAVLSIVGALAFLLSSPPRRRWLWRAEPYVAGMIALAVFAPVIAWNAAHGWASFAFQGARAGGLRFHPLAPLAVLAGEALFVLPWIWAGMAAAVWGVLADRNTKESPLPQGEGGLSARAREVALLFLAAPPILVFCAVALTSRGRVLFHWAAPGYLMLFPLLGAWLAARPRLAARAVRWTAVIVLLCLAVVASAVRLDWLHPAFAALHLRDLAAEATDWTSLRAELEARGAVSSGTVVGVTNWRDGGKIAHGLGSGFTVTCLCDDPREFGIAAPASSFAGRNMLVLATRPDEAARLAPSFAALTALPPAPIEAHGRKIGEVFVFRGTDFRSLKPG